MADIYHVPGPCSVSWGGVSLGTTKDGVRIRPSMTWIPVTDDFHGKQPADYIHGGKSAAVELVGLDVAAFKAAVPHIAGLLALDTGANNPVGKLVFTGDAAGANIGKELIITERDGSSLWQAKYAAPIDPAELKLSSTQELQLPLLFVVAMDENDELFYVMPSYVWTEPV